MTRSYTSTETREVICNQTGNPLEIIAERGFHWNSPVTFISSCHERQIREQTPYCKLLDSPCPYQDFSLVKKDFFR